MSAWDARPTLLYFHFSHEDESVGKDSLKQCKSLDDEKVARWSRLFNCVEIDVPASSRDLLKRWNVGDKPSFAVIDRDLNVVAESTSITNSKKIARFLESTLTKKLGEYWKGVQEELDDQKALYKEAQALIRKKELESARDRLHEVRTSPLRIGDWWDDARKQAEKLDKELTDSG